MSRRVDEVAERYGRAKERLIQPVEGVSDDRWRQLLDHEAWPIGVTAHRVAGGHCIVAGWVDGLAAGKAPLSFRRDDVYDADAAHAGLRKPCEATDSAAQVVGGLSDEQLDDAPAPYRNVVPLSAPQLVEVPVTGQVARHLGSIRAAPDA
jgi:hypothetical protein